MLHKCTVMSLIALTSFIYLGPVKASISTVLAQQSAESHYTASLQLLRNNEILPAIEELKMAIKLDPDVPEYHQYLGQTYMTFLLREKKFDKAGLYSDALREFRIARELNQHDIRSAIDYALHMSNAEEYGVTLNLNKCTLAWEHCLRLYNENALNEKMLTEDIHSFILMFLGRTELKRGNHEAAHSYFSEVLRSNPESAPARILLQKCKEGTPV